MTDGYTRFGKKKKKKWIKLSKKTDDIRKKADIRYILEKFYSDKEILMIPQ